MIYLDLHIKTGFRNNRPSEPVLIHEKTTGNIFYDTSWLEFPVKFFNLPEGEYMTNSDITMLKRPVRKRLHRLPRKERIRPKPDNFDIYFDNNPNKCSIDWDKGCIIYDHSLRNNPLPHLVFILYHELGHQHYSVEKNADAYARNMMLIRGYNESQIGDAILSTLNSRNNYRKELMVNSLIK